MELIKTVEARNYIVYAHGIQHDKSPKQILEFLNILNQSNNVLVICGRIRSNSRALINKILAHKKSRYVGNLDKLVLLSLLKNSNGVLITGDKEGVPRIMEEAKFYSLPIITQKQSYLANYDKHFVFKKFAGDMMSDNQKNDINDKNKRIQRNLENLYLRTKLMISIIGGAGVIEPI